MSETDETEQELENPTYTIDVNGKRYELNKNFRAAIQRRAQNEYRGNERFSCWWKTANRDDYSDEQWENNNHEEGDPILVIETEGPMVPWDQLDQLEMEMEDMSQEADYSDDADTTPNDSGNGMQTLPPEDAKPDDEEEVEEDESDRTHFSLTPQSFEEVPQPDGEDIDKLPPKPAEMDADPALIWWVPKHPEVQERWDTGEAIIDTYNWVEWNVQARADEIRIKGDEEKPNSHDHFESLCESHECEKVGEYTVSQDTPSGEAGSVKRKGKKQFEDGKYGGDNFHV